VDPPPAVASEDWSVRPFLLAAVRISAGRGGQWHQMTQHHVDLHPQGCISHLSTGRFRIEGFHKRGMFHFGVAEELVSGLEYPPRMIAIGAGESIWRRGISRLCLRPQCGHPSGVDVDIAGHGESRRLGGGNNLGS
jgi:hypothetical protein